MAAFVEQVSNCSSPKPQKMFTGVFKTPGAQFCAPREGADASAELSVVYGCAPAGPGNLGENGRHGIFLLAMRHNRFGPQNMRAKTEPLTFARENSAF